MTNNSMAAAYANTNGTSYTNREMYNKSRGGFSEGKPAFHTSDLGDFDGKMTFGKAPNGSVASIYTWLNNTAAFYEKVDGKWYRISNEKAKEIKDILWAKYSLKIKAEMKAEKAKKKAEEEVRSLSEDEASEGIKGIFGLSYEEILQRIEKVNTSDAKDFFDGGGLTLSIIEKMQDGYDYTITSLICGCTLHNEKSQSTDDDFDVSVKWNLDRTRDAIGYVDKARYCEITACHRGSECRKEFSFQGTDKWDFLVGLNNAVADVLEAYDETEKNSILTQNTQTNEKD